MFLKINKKIANICAITLGFSLPIATSLDTLSLVLLLITALIGWNSQYFRMIAQNPVAKAALLLFGILFAGCFYGITPPSDSIKVLTKYDDLILVALLLPIFSQVQMRLYGQYAFMSAMVLTLLLSYLIWLGVFQHTPLFTSRLPENPVVFKLHITHGILMGFAAFMFAIYAKFSTGKIRWLMLAAAILATCNVLLMTQGRTGYIVIIALSIYLLFALQNWRNILLGLGLIIMASSITYLASPKMQSRVTLAIHEIQKWQPMLGNNEASSIGTRMDYYTNAIKIISKNPLLGVGTGGFEAAYAKEIEGTTVAPSNNPHNQFLLFWAQVGVVGLSAFLYLLWTAWRAAARLPSPTEKVLARGLIITFITGSLFNSLLLDHAEGLFFAWLLGLLFAGLPSSKQS
ncbi:O-antigen ligase [Methylotenera sp.]|uniref:O-antigen ligase family protein n=1 Tax=Methylotenera sp. TaxID=2051956 RepID=UPI002730AD1C|nr:O-antigen ligase family protein [Methylotenera sp.]MDP2231582.1 O-antigen ligase family protein [Methylotenera sp.]